MREKRGPAETRSLKTLERVLSKAGLGSRTIARGWIGGGRVLVNGKTIRNPDQWVDPQRDRIAVDGKALRSAAKAYVLLYKPKGYLTTRRDPEGRPRCTDLTGDVGTWLSPVGRLDLDTSGLLLMTNDTEFAERIANPQHKAPKNLPAEGRDRAQRRADRPLAAGNRTERRTHTAGGSEAPAGQGQAHVPGDDHHGGRNRQVRRMVDAVGSKVLKLVRVAIGPVRIGDLEIGKWRPLTEAEVRALMAPRVNAPSGSRLG